MAQIVEGAKAEKELLTYATTQAPVMNRLVQGFNKKYPFLKVEYYRAGAEKIAQRFDTEAAAGRHVVDVVNLSGSEMYWTAKKGNFARLRFAGAKVDSPKLQRQARFVDGAVLDHRGDRLQPQAGGAGRCAEKL